MVSMLLLCLYSSILSLEPLHSCVFLLYTLLFVYVLCERPLLYTSASMCGRVHEQPTPPFPFSDVSFWLLCGIPRETGDFLFGSSIKRRDSRLERRETLYKTRLERDPPFFLVFFNKTGYALVPSLQLLLWSRLQLNP